MTFLIWESGERNPIVNLRVFRHRGVHGACDRRAPDEDGTASAAGLMNFIRTLSGAVATSITTTVWENKTNYLHAELAGLVDRTGDAARSLAASGMSYEATVTVLDNVTTGQSVMLATNGIFLYVTVAFCLGACLIWLAPKPTRTVSLAEAGH